MPPAKPPTEYDGAPRFHELRRGTCLWRVHSRAFRASAFNPRPADPLFGGARFDATTDDRYPYYYAALDETTAVAETMLRGLDPDEKGWRALQRPAVDGRRISGLTLTHNLELVSLVTGRDLAAIGQDAWLVTTPAHHYPQTRAWAHWLRGQAKQAHGFIWSSLREPGCMVVILFGDRCARDFGDGYEQSLLHEVPELATDLDDTDGARWLNSLLEPYRVAISPP